MTERKIYSDLSDVKIVDEREGVVQAFVNTMGAIDSDNDVIESGAFDESIKSNLPLPTLIGHDPNSVVGKVIAAQSVASDDGTSRLWSKIKFNMDTSAGRDAFSNVAGGFVRDWSVGFNVPDGGIELDRDEAGGLIRRIKQLDWVELSSVLRGASPGTSTISAKDSRESSQEIKRPLPVHDTPTVTTPWDSDENVRRLPLDDQEAYEQEFAFFVYGANPDAKSSYKFPHHEVSADGNVGAANVRACQSGIGVLNGAMGGSDIPDDARRGVYNHLAAHLRDADIEAGELRSLESSEGSDDDSRSHSPEQGDVTDALSDTIPADDIDVDAHDAINRRLLAARLRQAKKLVNSRKRP